MTITYPPEMLPAAEDGAQVVVCSGERCCLLKDNERLRATLIKAYKFISPLSDPMPISSGEMAREIMSALEQKVTENG